MLWACLLLLLAVVGRGVRALDNGLGRVPPMGYSTWYHAGCNVSFEVVHGIARGLTQGAGNLSALGYRYVNVDDCWALPRRGSEGAIRADPERFPQGMTAVGRMLHDKGLLFGIYTDRGTMTCARRAGSKSYEAQDAAAYAEWGVDFVKEDSCYASELPWDAMREYAAMRDAIKRTNRPMFFALCGWLPWYAGVGSQLANSWRISLDNNNWRAVFVAARTMEVVNLIAGGPGGWNDPDFLLGSSPLAFGKAHLTQRQSRTQFSLWCVMSAPLIVSAPDALVEGTFDHETYANARAIAVNQDVNGVPGRVAFSTCKKHKLPIVLEDDDNDDGGVEAGGLSAKHADRCTQIWFKGPLALRPNAVALVFVNWDPVHDMVVTCNAACMRKVGIPRSASIVAIEDVWSPSDDSDDNNNSDEDVASGRFRLVGGASGIGEEGPGTIQTTLGANGDSAFLIVEWGKNDNKVETKPLVLASRQ